MDHSQLLPLLNRRLDGARDRFPRLAEVPPLTAVHDIYSVPRLSKVDCLAEEIDLKGSGSSVLLASGGTSGKKRSMTTQSLEEFLIEGAVAAELFQRSVPAGTYGLVNTVSAGGLWGGGYMLFLASISHPDLVGLNVAGRSSAEMVEMLAGVAKDINGLDGLILVGLSTTLCEMANLVLLHNEILPVVSVIFGGEGLSRKNANLLRQAFPGATLHSYYSSSEGCCMGYSFGDDYTTLSPVKDSAFLWICDAMGNPILEPRKKGRIVVTNLYAMSKPFNFASNDMGEWLRVGETFRLAGRAENIISYPGLRLPAEAVIDDIKNKTGATAVQFHLYDLVLQVVVDRADYRSSGDELLDIFLKALGFSTRDAIPEGIELVIGGIERSKVGKTPLVIDFREGEIGE